MALSMQEKQLLDNYIIDKLNEFIQCNIDHFEISDLIGTNVPVQMSCPKTSIRSSLGRIDHSKVNKPFITNYVFGRPTYDFVPYDVINIETDTKLKKIRKEKNMLIWEDIPLTYDFATKQFNINIDHLYLRNKPYEWLQETLRNYHPLDYEWIFNYTDDFFVACDITRACMREAYQTMPAGLFEALKTEKISPSLVENMYLKNKYGKYAKFIGLVYNYSSTSYSNIAKFFEQYSPKDFVKIAENNLLNGRTISMDIMGKLIRNIIQLQGININYTLDNNRDLSTNYDAVMDLLKGHENEMLETQLHRLNFLNGYTKDNYVIVVPQTQKDKQDEGRMQNNCVGHYYDNRIKQGTDLIYFIRKADNPTHSYITCRYNVGDKMTVEYRLKNNYAVNEKTDKDFIKEIDEMIRANLK